MALEGLGVVPAPADGDLVGYPTGPPQEPDEHQTALDEAALGPIATGAVHPQGSIENLLIDGDVKDPAEGVERRDGAVKVLPPVGVVNPGANVARIVQRLSPNLRHDPSLWMEVFLEMVPHRLGLDALDDKSLDLLGVCAAAERRAEVDLVIGQEAGADRPL